MARYLASHDLHGEIDHALVPKWTMSDTCALITRRLRADYHLIARVECGMITARDCDPLLMAASRPRARVCAA